MKYYFSAMKRILPIIVLLAILSVISGILMSGINFIGSLGISLIHQEYHFLEVWWQGALAVFAVLLILLAMQGILKMKLPKSRSAILQTVLFLLALVGLYFTYNDFRHSFTHKIIGERFHLGAYLFWVGWMIISLYYLFTPKNIVIVKMQDNPKP
jgi:hypothetical protein